MNKPYTTLNARFDEAIAYDDIFTVLDFESDFPYLGSSSLNTWNAFLSLKLTKFI